MRQFTKYPCNYIKSDSDIDFGDPLNQDPETLAEDVDRLRRSDLFKGRVPKRIQDRTLANMDQYHMGLADSFEEAVKELAPKGSELWYAWYYNDFRKFIPSAYDPQYLDFKKYPLAYIDASTQVETAAHTEDTSVMASSSANPYMKDLAEYLDYLSDAEIEDIKIEHIADGYEPECWIEIPEHLRSTVENAVGAELCSPNEAYWYQIEYHPDDDSIVFGINTDLNLETLRGVSKQTEDRFKAKFKRELGI